MTNALSDDNVIFDHIGLLTKNPDGASKSLSILGFSISDSLFDSNQGAYLRMAQSPDSHTKIEIISPCDDESALNSLLRHRNDYMYHSCFRVQSVKKILNRLRHFNLRVTEMSKPKPAVMFDGDLVSFYVIEGIGLVEFIESKI